MNKCQMTKERRRILNQLSLDLLLRRLGTTVLRRKFQEIYAQLNSGKEWKDGRETGEKFCQSTWGNPAFVNAQQRQQEMMQEGIISNWDLHCLQFVITKMLTTAALEQKREQDQSNISRNWKREGNLQRASLDRSWWVQMLKIRQLANIRHSIAHMPNETLSQDEFEEKWEDAVDALKSLGAKSKEIAEIRKITQSALNPPVPAQQGQSQMSNGQNEHGQNKPCEENLEMTKIVEELRAKIDELQLKIQAKGQDEVKVPGDQDVQNQLYNDNVFHKENMLRADSLTNKGDLASRSGDWDKTLEFYTRVLEIPGISDEQRRKIYMNRSWVNLQVVLQMPEYPFNFNLSDSESTNKKSKKANGKLPAQNQNSSQRTPKFVDENLIKMDQQKWPKKLTDEVKKCHLTAGIADVKSAIQLSPGKKSPAGLHRLAQFHQLKGDWKTALTHFDRALGQSDLDTQLELDRNACQLELLNQAEVEEFHWIPGQKNQTMAGIMVWRNTQKWIKILKEAMSDPGQQLYAQVLKAHFLAQGLSCEEGRKNEENRLEVSQQTFGEAVKLYEGAANGGLPSGFYNLGLLLQEGNGVSLQDFSGAVRLFKMAANFPIDGKTPDWMKEGILEAQYRLGLCYEFGLGVGKDDRRALHWYEMASLGDFAKASRKLAYIYKLGLLGVSKDRDMADFCSINATFNGDKFLDRSETLNILLWYPVKCVAIGISLYSFSRDITLNSQDGSPTMLATALKQKRDFESILASFLHKLTPQPNSERVGQEEKRGNEDREPEEVSWNVPAYVEYSLHTLHLLDLVQTTKFRQKLKATPNWQSQFSFTGRLVMTSNSATKGLLAFQELNKLYRDVLIKANQSSGQQVVVETDYPPDLRKIPDVDQAVLAREAKLVSVVLTSFAVGARLVGTVYFRDHLSQGLMMGLVRKIFSAFTELHSSTKLPTLDEICNWYNAYLLHSYLRAIEEPGVDSRKVKYSPEQNNTSKEDLPFIEHFPQISRATVQGSLGTLEETTIRDIDDVLKQLEQKPEIPKFLISKIDLLFVKAVCVKSAGLTRGVNSANRKKVNEAMDNFQKFLSICPKDEPRRAEAHYQLALCTLYLEKMKVKGQVKSSANDILDKVLLHFTQGEKAEQELPWKDFQLSPKSSVKLLLEEKLRELKALAKKDPGQTLTSDSKEGDWEKSDKSCVGRVIHPIFKFPISSFPLKMRGARRVEVITKFRKFFKAAHCGVSIGSSPSTQVSDFADLIKLPGSPLSLEHVVTRSDIVGCYEVVEPILYCRQACEGREMEDQIVAFTVVQDESGAVFNLQLNMRPRGDKDEAEQIGGIQMGDQIILLWPFIQLDAVGERSLLVENAEAEVFHLSPTYRNQVQQQSVVKDEEKLTVTRKCGFCGKSRGNLQQCSKCQVVYYCGKECQTTDWTEMKHKWICPFLQYQLLLSSSFCLAGPGNLNLKTLQDNEREWNIIAVDSELSEGSVGAPMRKLTAIRRNPLDQENALQKAFLSI